MQKAMAKSIHKREIEVNTQVSAHMAKKARHRYIL